MSADRSRSPIPKACLTKEEALSKRWDRLTRQDRENDAPLITIESKEQLDRALGSRHLNSRDKSILKILAAGFDAGRKVYLDEFESVTSRRDALMESLHHMATWRVIDTVEGYSRNKVFSPYELPELRATRAT